MSSKIVAKLLGRAIKLPQEYKWSSYNGYTDKANDKYIDKKAIKTIASLGGERYEIGK